MARPVKSSTQKTKTEQINRKEVISKKFEIISGITIAVFAAFLAIIGLGAGRYGGDEIIAHNEKAAAFQWYQSKAIKQTLTEAQRDLLKSLVDSGSIARDKTRPVQKYVKALDDDILRYGKEKKEILLGSQKVGKENWAQEQDGKLGQIVGANEWEAKANQLGDAGDFFDMSTLFLQMSLVLGAISLVVQNMRLKLSFYAILIILGVIGLVYGAKAYMVAMA
ncbi:MAG TPA: DUF4337 domain-containing protein [Spirochaetota bacterium]